MKVDRELTLEEQEELLTLKAQGLSGQEIANIFNQKKGTNFAGQDILDYINKRKINAVKVMQNSGKIEGELAQKYFDSITQLNELNRSMWEAFIKIKESEEYKQSTVICPKCNNPVKVAFKSAAELVKAADHLMKQIEHVDRVLQRLKTTGLNISYNITELTQQIQQVMPKVLETYEKKGEIKIKKKRILKRIELEENN